MSTTEASRAATAGTNARPSLVRAMTRWDLTALAINGIIGAGIFGLPSSAAQILGASSPIAFVLCAIVVYVFVLCFAEAASHFTETGGPYLYARTIFGPFVGFEVGWSLWLARVSAFGANSNVLVSYLGFLIPQVTSGLARAFVLILVPLILTMINIRGVSGAARFGGIFAAAKVVALVLFSAVGLAFVDWNGLSGMSFSPSENWGGAILLLIYAFTGFEHAVIPAAEAKNPRKDLAWALIIALGICAAIYLAIQVVALGTVPDLATSQRPLADSARNFWGPIAGGLISLLVCISVIGNLSALVLVSPRLTYAFSERRDFPVLFAKLHPAYGTPAASIIFFTAIGSILAISGTFVWLVTVSVVARLANYFVTCLTVPVLRKRSAEPPQFKIPLGPAVPVAGMLLCLWLFTNAAWTDIRSFALACGAGALLYFARPRS
jgi:amino acid transporter